MKNLLADHLVHLFLRFGRRRTFVSRQFEYPLSVNESNFLTYVACHANCSAQDVGRALLLEKSTVSRIMSALQEKGFLNVKSSASDQRVRELSLSERGREVMQEDQKTRDAEMRKCLTGVSEREQGDLAVYLGMLADGFNAPRMAHAPSVHRCHVEVQRLSISMGAFGDDFLGSGLSLERMQMLLLLHASGEAGLPLSRLRVLLPYDPSFQSRMIHVLQEEGWINRHVHTEDRRHAHVHLSARGEKEFLKARTAAVRKMAEAVTPQLEKHLQAFTDLMSHWLGSDDTSRSLDVIDGIRIRLIKTEDERVEARKFLVEQLVRSEQHEHLPEFLFHPQHFNAAAYEDNFLRGVIEVAKVNRFWEISNFAVQSALPSPRLPLELVVETLRLIFSRRKTDVVFLQKRSPAFLWLQNYLPAKHMTEEKIPITEDRLEMLEEAMSVLP